MMQWVPHKIVLYFPQLCRFVHFNPKLSQHKHCTDLAYVPTMIDVKNNKHVIHQRYTNHPKSIKLSKKEKLKSDDSNKIKYSGSEYRLLFDSSMKLEVVL